MTSLKTLRASGTKFVIGFLATKSSASVSLGSLSKAADLADFARSITALAASISSGFTGNSYKCILRVVGLAACHGVTSLSELRKRKDAPKEVVNG